MWKFNPIYKRTIWGGSGIASYKQIPEELNDIGESWEISAIPSFVSVVSEGPDKGLSLDQLLKKYKEQLLGTRNWSKCGSRFPLLIKFIDAKEDLSIQVHPHDSHAMMLNSPNGKDELWYIIAADKGARVASGFKSPMTKSEFLSVIESGDILDHVNLVEVKEGMALHIPGGRIHAIGKGVFLAEIQQTSDITFRVHDYGRIDRDGKRRELHLDKAGTVIDFSDTDPGIVDYTCDESAPTTPIFSSKPFCTSILKTDKEYHLNCREHDSFVILIGISGKAEINSSRGAASLSPGETMLLGADEDDVRISGRHNFKALVVRMDTPDPNPAE